jgi:membrane fusion protein (multidrug efflux system)
MIRAPFTGLITERMVQVGHHIRLGDELFSVADFDPLVARIYLPERDILGLEENREVRISLQADDSIVFQGRVRQISPVVDVATGTVKVTVEATKPPRVVRPGAFVTIDIERERHADVVLLPRESVIRELQSSHVFIAHDDVAYKRPVTLGLEEGELIEALAGVEAGEQVIVAGQGGLKDGAPVKIIQVADAELGG